MKARTTILALLFAVFFSLPVVSNSETFKIGLDQIPRSLDPYADLSHTSLRYSRWVFDPLIEINRGLVVPQLATSWERIDELTMRFHLRRGVKFHSGNPFTSHDVKFTLDRLKRSENFNVFFKMFTEAVVVDDYTVDIKTKKPYGLLLHMCSYIFPMDREFYSSNDFTDQSFAMSNESGTGPFSVLGRPEYGIRMVLNRFEGYWNKAAQGNVNKITISSISEDATRVAALLSGDVDLIFPVPFKDINRIKESQNFNLFSYPGSRIITLQLNQRQGSKFQDKRVRQAVVHAIDNESIVKEFLKGDGAIPAAQFSPKGYPGHMPTLKPLYDLNKAKELMKDAGLSSGFECTMIAPNNRYINDEKVAVAVVGMLKEINIRVNLKTMPQSIYWDEFKANVADIQMIGWFPATEDSADYLEFLAMCPNKETGYGRYNSGTYCNPEVDQLILAAQMETDLKRRKTILQGIEKILYDAAAFVPLYWQNKMFAYNKSTFDPSLINIICTQKTSFRRVCDPEDKECPNTCKEARIKCDEDYCCVIYN